MAEEFEVKALHDEMMEELAEERAESTLATRVALYTAILSTAGAVFAFRSASSEVEAASLRSDALLLQAKASDQWSYYQAKNQRGYMAGILARVATDPAAKASLLADAARYATEKDQVRKEAEKLQQAAEDKQKEAETNLQPHHRLAFGMSILQVAVALASITVLTRKKWLFLASATAGIAAVSICLTAFFL